MQQHCYTSVPRGLMPGKSGYTTVAQTRGMGRSLTDMAERLSAFSPLDPNPTAYASEPVNWFHMVVTQGAARSHFVSRVGACPPDYTGRSNYFAHHLILTPQETAGCAAGPAELLAEPGLVKAEWNGDPRELDAATVPSVGIPQPDASAIAKAGLDPAWAQELADRLQDPSIKQIWLVYPRGADILGIVRDVLSHLPGADRWKATFATHATKSFPGMGFEAKLRCVVAGTPYAQEVLSRYRDAIDVGKRPECPERKVKDTAPSTAVPAGSTGPAGPAPRPVVGPLGGRAPTKPPTAVDTDRGSAAHEDRTSTESVSAPLPSAPLPPPVGPAVFGGEAQSTSWWASQPKTIKRLVVVASVLVGVAVLGVLIKFAPSGSDSAQVAANGRDRDRGDNHGRGGSGGRSGEDEADGASGSEAGHPSGPNQPAPPAHEPAPPKSDPPEPDPPKPAPPKPDPPKPDPPKPEVAAKLIDGATAKLRTAKREEKIVEDLADLPKDGLEIKKTPQAGIVEHSLEHKSKEWVLKVGGKEACRFAHEKDKLTVTFLDYDKSPQRSLAHGLTLVVKPGGSAQTLAVPLGEPLDLALSIKGVKGEKQLKPGSTYEFMAGNKKDADAFANCMGYADGLVDVFEFEGTSDLKPVTREGPDGGFVVVDKRTGRGVVLKRQPLDKKEKGKPVEYKCTHYVVDKLHLPKIDRLVNTAAKEKAYAKTALEDLQKAEGKGGVMTPQEYHSLSKAVEAAANSLMKYVADTPPIRDSKDPNEKAAWAAEAEGIRKCLPSIEDCELAIADLGKGVRVTLRKSFGDRDGIVVVDSLGR